MRFLPRSTAPTPSCDLQSVPSMQAERHCGQQGQIVQVEVPGTPLCHKGKTRVEGVHGCLLQVGEVERAGPLPTGAKEKKLGTWTGPHLISRCPAAAAALGGQLRTTPKYQLQSAHGNNPDLLQGAKYNHQVGVGHQHHCTEKGIVSFFHLCSLTFLQSH